MFDYVDRLTTRICSRLISIVSVRLFIRFIGLNFGDKCRFIDIKHNTFGSEPYLITIGDHVTITSGVRFITHDGGVWVFRDEFPEIDVIAPITVGDNSFLGMGVIVLPGAEIGNDVVVGAGSVVKGKLDAGGVYAGVPARKLCSIDAYKNKSLDAGLHVKNMDAKAKKTYLKAHFHL